jgi:hypothetical protein
MMLKRNKSDWRNLVLGKIGVRRQAVAARRLNCKLGLMAGNNLTTFTLKLPQYGGVLVPKLKIYRLRTMYCLPPLRIFCLIITC